MKIAAFKYSYPDHKTANVGDSIQTLAVTQHLPRVDCYIDRDHLDTYDGDECVLVMNGWFSHRPTAWPPSKKIIPIFHGFHLAKTAADYYSKYVDYFKKFQPIGCRDRSTLEIVQSWGVEAYLSLCSTLTFPTRQNVPVKDYYLLADVSKTWLPPNIRKHAVPSPHAIAPVDSQTQRIYAENLLRFYREHITHALTSRIHAAMPCIAMGIPTLYLGRKNNRTSLLTDVGVPDQYILNKKSPLHGLKKLTLGKNSFYEPAIDQLKADIIGRLAERLAEYGIQYASSQIDQQAA